MGNSRSNDLDWQGYEEVTKYIYEMLGSNYGIKVIGYGKDCKVKGKSGVEHQIDILTEHFDGKNSHLTAIECKFLKKKITKEIVMKLQSEMLDADVESGIIVCKSGFTKDTQTYAEHVGIKLVELREAGENDLNGEHEIGIGILELHNKITVTRAKITIIDLGNVQITDEQELMRLRFPGTSFIESPQGRRIPFERFVNEYCFELSLRNQLWKTISIAYPPFKGKLIRNYINTEIEIEKIEFTGFLGQFDASSKKSFKLVDQVWMIMKEIFEKTEYRLSQSGILFKNIHDV